MQNALPSTCMPDPNIRSSGPIIPGKRLLGSANTATQLVDALALRVLRRTLSTADRDRFIAFAANGGSATATLDSATLTLRGKEMLGLLLSSAYFQYR